MILLGKEKTKVYLYTRVSTSMQIDGLHEALVSEEVWEQAQIKVAAQAKNMKR
jgi:site-specific DNA recombinase